MNMIVVTSLITVVLFSSYTKAQQNYTGNSVFNCNENNSLEFSLYTCNGRNSSCKAFLIFIAKSPYNTVLSIASLTSSNQIEIAKLNNATQFTVFRTDQEVIIPVHCSCSGGYYQSNTSYEIPSTTETYYLIANNTYQGLSTCGSLKNANIQSEFDLQPGYNLRVPLRCACPTNGQIAEGTKYLMTYSVGQGDTIVALSEQFNVSSTSLIRANSLSDEYSTLHPFTTILAPLPNEPLSSQTIIRSPKMTVLPSTLPATRKSPSKQGIYIVAVLMLFILFMIISIIIFRFQKKRKREQKYPGRNEKISSHEDLIVEIGKLDCALKVFKFSAIKKGTGNFRSKNRIKGCVYLGAWGKDIYAVKKINGNAWNEVNMLYQINHFNIVKLEGFCENEGDMYLVYEFMKNGSLKEWLGRSKLDGICWKKRIQIALDVANGLLYLHYFTKPGYVHNDIRSSNILLDRNLRAKIANFNHARTENEISLTRQHLAPECSEKHLISAKVDVFAFGVILLELVTGKYQLLVQGGSHKVLTMTISDIMENGNAETALRRLVEPPGLLVNGGMEYAVQVVKLSSRCLSENPEDRPTMVEVVSILLKVQHNLQKSAPAKQVIRQAALSIKAHNTTFSSYL